MESIPWIPIAILTVVFGFFGPTYVSILPNATWYALGRIGCKLLLTVMPLFFIMGAAVVGKLLGKPISLAKYTYLYAAGMGLIMSNSSDSFPIGSPFIELLYDRVGLSPDINPWPSLVAPSVGFIAPMTTGGVAIPWGAWIPTFIWWWLLLASCAVFFIGFGVVWRRRWIDVEKVPFPHTRVGVELIDRITSAEKSLKARLGMPFAVGLILGVVFQLPLLLTYLFPWFPDIYGWRTNTCTMGAQWITPDSPLAGIAGLAQFNKNPAFGAIFYLAPLNVLFGAWFWYLVFMILTQIAFTTGYYTGITGESGCGRVWCGTVSYRVGDPFKWNAFSSAGVTTGIFISYIALNWSYLSGTFNAAIGRLSADKLAEYNKSEPTSYRNAYAMMAISLIVFIAVFMATGVGLPAAILLLITSIVVTFVSVRSYSLVGFVVPAGSNFYEGPMKMLLGGNTAGGVTQWYMAMGFTYSLSCEPITGGGNTLPFLSSLASFQMANINNVSTKNVLKILLFVCVLAPLLSVIGATWGFYTFGITKMPTSLASWYSWHDSYTPDALANRPTYEPWWPHMLAGIVFAIILSAMHARLVWFPLEPIGFLLATDGHALIEGIWTMALVAWIAKTITLRVGGSKLYERTGIPVAIGFIIGVVIVSLIGGALLVFRFFVPF